MPQEVAIEYRIYYLPKDDTWEGIRFEGSVPVGALFYNRESPEEVLAALRERHEEDVCQ